MEGLITTRHLVLNAREIIAGFGLTAWWRCVRSALSRRRVTFLEVVFAGR